MQRRINEVNKDMTRIVLVRHGQTVWNREERFRGRADIELDEFGRKQAQVTARYVAARWPVVAVYASPARRAMQTADAVAQAQGLTVQPLKGLIDIDFGEWQGQLASEMAERYPELFQTWVDMPHKMRFPGGEGLDDVRRRLVAALDQVVARHPEHTVALVAHTVANRVLLCAVLGLGNEHFWRLRQDTCAVNVFDVEDNGTYTIGLLNDTSHMQSLSP